MASGDAAAGDEILCVIREGSSTMCKAFPVGTSQIDGVGGVLMDEIEDLLLATEGR